MSTASKKKKIILETEEDDNFQTGLGKFLGELRAKAGLTQKQVADVLGFSTYQFIYNMEKEKCLPPKQHLKPLAKLYKIEDRKLRIEIVKHLYTKVKRKYGFR